MRRWCRLTRAPSPTSQHSKLRNPAFIRTLSSSSAIRGRASTSAVACFIVEPSSRPRSITPSATSSARRRLGSLSGRRRHSKLASIISRQRACLAVTCVRDIFLSPPRTLSIFGYLIFRHRKSSRLHAI